MNVNSLRRSERLLNVSQSEKNSFNNLSKLLIFNNNNNNNNNNNYNNDNNKKTRNRFVQS